MKSLLIVSIVLSNKADCAKSLGVFRVKTFEHLFDMSVDLFQMKNWRKTGEQVQKCAGYRCVIMVVQQNSGQTHSVVCIRWNHDDSIAVQNSWGPDKVPFPNILPHQFVSSYLLEAKIHKMYAPHGKYIKETATPAELPEWAFMSPAQ